MTWSSVTPRGRTDVVRLRLQVRGLVQGVGFRPFVHRLATAAGLVGHVGNDTRGVVVEVEGPSAVVDEVAQQLVTSAPPLARVDAIVAAPLPVVGGTGFRIVDSTATGPAGPADSTGPADAAGSAAEVATFVAPDAAVCDDCLAEVFDPADRRYRYPFATCTNCGPRFTITERLPYDRATTTMAGFPLCGPCAAEYHDPADRRFHAQPLACPDCGPQLSFVPGDAGGDAALAAAQRVVCEGGIVAVKGLGGYHLACDPRSDAAVARLRARKARAEKPFAVMVRDLDVARRMAVVGALEARLLSGPARPIVLLDRRGAGSGDLSALVAPDNPLLGVMLPYTPLHHLLLAYGGPDALVMTSGNLSGEPLAHEDDDARRRLAAIADGWLLHDRPIHVPCDDSVVRVVGGAEMPVRRSRGHAPLPLTLPVDGPPVLAVGGELKTTFCLTSGRRAWMSQHIGDMGSVETLAAFERSVRQFGAVYGVVPSRLVADMHPGYHTRQWADEHGDRPPLLVQHHHAHVAGLMAEHGVGPGEPIIGIACDGTGYGPDGTIWGGEILRATYTDATRVAHLAYVPLPGGDSTIRRPYRAALAHLHAAGIDWSPTLAPVRAASPDELSALSHQLDTRFQCTDTSSTGRLFDAVTSLLDLHHEVTYEAQAPITLETLARSHPSPAARYHFTPRPAIDEAQVIDPAPVLRAIVDDLRSGSVDRAAIAADFHRALARALAEAAARAAEEAGIRRVGLTGGVFQNAVLVDLVRTALETRGLTVLTHHVVPPNDGGLALGQAAIATARLAAGESGPDA
jgi:hydrogenase maturation protein HypF